MTNPQDNDFFVIAIVIAKWCFLWGIFIWWQLGPCFANCLFARRFFQLIVGFLKWLPCVFRTHASQGSHLNSWAALGKWLPYGQSSLDNEVISPLEHIKWVLMHSNGELFFAWRRFRLTAISEKWIIIVMRGTTVWEITGMGLSRSFVHFQKESLLNTIALC